MVTKQIKPSNDSQSNEETPTPQTTEGNVISQEVSKEKEKKCRVCGAPAQLQNTLIFALDVGYTWSVEKVYLCDSHAENLDDSDLDQAYVKNRLAHLTRVRQRQNKAIPPSTNSVNKTNRNVNNKK
jgi:hypothetical protein